MAMFSSYVTLPEGKSMVSRGYTWTISIHFASQEIGDERYHGITQGPWISQLQTVVGIPKSISSWLVVWNTFYFP